MIVDQEQEDVAVRGIQRGRIAADLDIGVVNPGGPVEDARHLPARVTGAIARDALHRLDQFMVVDAAVVGAGHRAQFGAAIFRLEGLHLLGAVVCQTVLQVDPCQRRGKLPQVGGRSADDAGKLAESPMRGRDRFLRLRQDQVQPLCTVARCLDTDVGGLHHPAAAALRATLHIGPEIVERQVPLVIRPVEPFGRHPPVPLASAYIYFPATRPRRLNRIQNFHNTHRHFSVTGPGSHSPSHQPVTEKPAELKLSRANVAKSEVPHARNSPVLTCARKWQRLKTAFLAGRCARHAKLCSDLDFEQQTSCHRRV